MTKYGCHDAQTREYSDLVWIFSCSAHCKIHHSNVTSTSQKNKIFEQQKGKQTKQTENQHKLSVKNLGIDISHITDWRKKEFWEIIFPWRRPCNGWTYFYLNFYSFLPFLIFIACDNNYLFNSLDLMYILIPTRHNITSGGTGKKVK